MPAPPESGLSEAQIRGISEGRIRARKIRRAVAVARISGWTLACFAALSLLGGLFGLRSLLLGAALAGIAWTELRGAKGLSQFDPLAARRLGFNQLILIVVIAGYSIWGMLEAVLGASQYAEMTQAGGPGAQTYEAIDRLTKVVTVAFYITVMVGAAVVQSLTAAYYFTRAKHIRAYVAGTPEWVVRTLKAAA